MRLFTLSSFRDVNAINHLSSPLLTSNQHYTHTPTPPHPKHHTHPPHRWNKLGMHLRDPRIREQVHVEMVAALDDLQQRCDLLNQYSSLYSIVILQCS
jgi:hypothetical protein